MFERLYQNNSNHSDKFLKLYPNIFNVLKLF
jgi:hypothetical protein